MLSWEAELTLLALILFLCILSQLMLSIRAATVHVPFKTYTNSVFCEQRLASKLSAVLLEALIILREKRCYRDTDHVGSLNHVVLIGYISFVLMENIIFMMS